MTFSEIENTKQKSVYIYTCQSILLLEVQYYFYIYKYKWSFIAKDDMYIPIKS